MELLVNVDEIKEAGLEIRREFTATEVAALLEATPPTGFRAAGPALFSVHLERVNERDIVARGGMRIEATAECRRCLGSVRLAIPVEFMLDFVPRELVPELEPSQTVEDDGEGEVAGTFTADEADRVVYEGRSFDLEPVVREQVLLALPMDALCSEDCKGLCQVCGSNRNEGECGCDRHVPDPRWAALKNIKLS